MAKSQHDRIDYEISRTSLKGAADFVQINGVELQSKFKPSV